MTFSLLEYTRLLTNFPLSGASSIVNVDSISCLVTFSISFSFLGTSVLELIFVPILIENLEL